MQLASKMRFLAAQFDALISDELWLRCAGQANAMAARLAGALGDVPGLTITRPVQTNAVFAALPVAVTGSLQREHAFYVWDEAAGEVRSDVLVGHDRGGCRRLRDGRPRRARRLSH